MRPVALQKKQTQQPTVAPNGNPTNNPLQLKQPANNPLQNTGEVVQRVIVLGDKTYNEGDADKLRADYPEEKYPNRDQEILTALSDFSPPKTLEGAVKDERRFLVYCDYEEELQGYAWRADLGQAVKETEKVKGGSITYAGKNGAFIQRPAEGFAGIKIDGLIDCVGLIIEAKDEYGDVVAAAGGHFVTPSSITDHAINGTGMDMINGLVKLVTGFGKLSAITMIAKGSMHGADKGSAYQDGQEAAGLIEKALGIPTILDDGKSERIYRLYYDGAIDV